MTDADARLSQVYEMLVALASNHFERRLEVGDGTEELDAVAAGLNMLAEELAAREQREREVQLRISQAERLAAVGQLAAGVAHEVNNPASFVLANTADVLERLREVSAVLARVRALFPPGSEERRRVGELLDRADVDAALSTSTEMLEESVAGLDRVVAVIADLHAFSRIESEHLRSVDVEAVVNEACKLVQKQASYRARLTRRLGVTGPVRGDHHRLVQVVAGLLVNAIHAVPEGAPEQNEIEVGTASSRGEVRVWVRDTGAGMTPEVRARVFEPFFTTKPADSGTGLGLSIAAEIVRRYGGHIDVKSEPGEGSTFTVTLPAVDVALAPAPVPSATAVSRARVLIIDDEKALLKVFARLLGVRHEVVLATGGREALALIEGGLVPDVVLCDLMMPEIDGVAVHDELARSHPALAERMLFMSGGTYTPRTQRFLDQHPGRVLPKPIKRADLEEAVARSLAARS